MGTAFSLLFVDDDLEIQNYFSVIAQSCDVIVTMAATVHEAKEYISHNTYDAYILDECLPDGTGSKLAAWIRENIHAQVPIAIVSSYYQEASAFLNLKEVLKIQYVLQKPLKENQIHKLIQELSCAPNKVMDPGSITNIQRLYLEYAKSIPSKISVLIKLVKEVQDNPKATTIKNLKGEVHKLGGNAGSYGFPQVTNICKKLDQQLADLLENSDENAIDSEWLSSLDDFLRELKYHFQIGPSQSSGE